MSDLSEKRELSDAAKALMQDKAFQAAILSLRKRWFGELLEESGNTLRQSELCSRLRALEMLPHELGTLVNDYKVAAQKDARGSGSGA
jgi:hypothetical protein